jgi:predicted AAA+ superfamily ATPase
MWIKRVLADELRKLTASFPVVALVGPRQVGKTSLLEHDFPEFRYVSLDTASQAEMAETRPAEFLQRFPPPVIIDEVQYAPALFRHIKAYVDAHRHEKGLFLLTGSQNYALMQEISDSLAGRAAVIPFLGLSGAEWLASPVAAGSAWGKFWLRGGYPGLWNDPTVSRERWYQGYLATYLERDVRNILRVGSLRDFERFLRACAARCAQTLNMSDLGRDVGISATTAREWIGALQASNQILLLEPYHRSLGKRLVKSPKLYFTDTGLAAFLMGPDR